MSCAQMLDLMLEADPAELAGQGGSVLAGHVRECGRCRAVTRQILADTRLLESALAVDVARRTGSELLVPSSQFLVPSSNRTLLPWGLVALAAAAAAIAVLSGVDTVDRRSPPRVVRSAAVEAAKPTPPQTRGAPEDVMASRRTARTRTPVGRAARRAVAIPVAPVAFPVAVAIEPARFALSNAEDEPSVRAEGIASADAAPAKRVAVLRTSDPTITVYWLY